MVLNVTDLIKYVQATFPTLPVNATWFNTEFGKIKTAVNSIVEVMKAQVGALTPFRSGTLPNNSIAGTTAFKMFGFGGSMPFTPKRSGTVIVIGAFRAVGTTTTATNGDDYALYYGTGTAPANGAAVTGTQALLITCSTPNGITNMYPLSGVITGLTPGTTYWLDMAGLVGSGTTTMQLFGPTFTFQEL